MNMGFWQDFQAGIARRHLWLFMGWRDVHRRYMRSVLGPLWLVINALLTVSILGPLYSYLFKIPMADYLVYMITGVLTWQMIAQIFNEMPVLYANNASLITDVNLPFSVYHFQMLFRNLIVYANSLAIIFIVTLLFGTINWSALLLLPFGIILVLLNCYFLSNLIAALGTRFRDVVPIIVNMLQAAFYATPIIWKKEMLMDYQFLNHFNPFFHAVEVMRAPFLGEAPHMISYAFLIVTAIIALLLNIICFPRIRLRLAFWL